VWFSGYYAYFEERSRKILQNFFQKSLEVKKKALPLHSQMKNGALERERHDNKFIEKTGIYTVQEASTEKNKIYREALISLEIKRSVRTS
jgi:hypothetical protein